jgi:hypothetical protein
MKLSSLTGAVAAALLATGATAAEPTKKKALAEPPPPAWLDTLTIDGYLDAGVAVNFANPFNRFNFGHLFTDRASWPQFNQGVLTIERPLDPKATDIDFGFKVQGLIGTDGRYTHYLGELDYLIHDRTQLALVEAHGLVHLPILTQGGVDIKVGQFVTLNGTEVITAKDNLFYTHSYIFNFGPFMHTGVMTTTHATDWLDVYAGVTTGTNTSIGWPGDNNSAAAFHGGFIFNLLDGELTIAAITHSGPDNPKQLDPLGVGWPNTPLGCACDPNHTWRFYNNLTTTWKPTENLTLITDIAYFRESGGNPISVTGLPYDALDAFGAALGFDPTLIPSRPQGADAYGVAQYISYKVNDIFTVNGRVEYFRDNKNFFVAGFPGYFDAVNTGHGFFAPSVLFAPAPTSYLELTAGVTISPPVPENPVIKGLILRPEFRWDTSLNGTAPFFGPNGSRKRSTGMFAMDVIVPFSIR